MNRSLLLVLLALGASPATADELRLDAKALTERSITRDVRLTPDGAAVLLEEGELFEDDGPAAGYSYRPNEEKLSDTVRARKELIVPNPVARKATLLVAPGGDMKLTVNGKPVESKLAGKAGNYWQAYTLPPDALRIGKNEFVLHGAGRVWVARAEDFAAGSVELPAHPGRSAKSGDAGVTWAGVDGEFYARLFLDHYRPAGVLTLPVLDAGNLVGRAISPPLAKPVPVRVRLDADPGRAGSVRIFARSGTSAAPNSASWSAWAPLGGGELRDPRGRFVQFAVVLRTDDPLETPRLKGVRIEADLLAADWSAKLKVLESENPEIVRSSVPFEYEPFDHPKLKELRTRHKLDEVVKGAKSEFEMIERLARWSAGCWDRGHLKDAYPPWDALEILAPHADGTPTGGFCQQYNLLLLQAGESFGIPGRAVSIGVGDHGGKVRGSGHEVVELWSNDFRKWVYIDGNMSWYATDAKTSVPLSLLELRDRQLRVVAGKPGAAVRIVHLRDGGKRWEGLDSWPAFLELRLIPRSNFLQAKAPLPLNQGMRGWFWTGHHVWTDAEYPAGLLYGNRVSDRRNWEWTLNTVRITLEATATPGELRVHLATETPGFDAFLADIDGTGPKPVRSGFVWKLQAGKNRLEVRSRNVAGREGPASRMVIDHP